MQINSIQRQLFRNEYESINIKNEYDVSLDNLKKEFEENYFNLSNNNNINNNFSNNFNNNYKNKKEDFIIDFDKKESFEKLPLVNSENNNNDNNIQNDKEISNENLKEKDSENINYNNNNLITIPKEKIELLFDKLFELSREKEDKDKKLILLEEEKDQKDNHIKELEKILEKNSNGNIYKRKYDSTRNSNNNHLTNNPPKKVGFSTNTNQISSSAKKNYTKSFSVDAKNKEAKKSVIPKGKIYNLSKEKLNSSLENSKDKIDLSKKNSSNSNFKLNITPVKSSTSTRNNSVDKRSRSINNKKTGLPPLSIKKKN